MPKIYENCIPSQVENYEKYILDCEERERSEQETGGEGVKIDPVQAEKWKERRECLEMLKRELGRVRDSGDTSQDWDYLLEEDETKEETANITEIQDNEISKDICNDNALGSANATKQVIEPKKDK